MYKVTVLKTVPHFNNNNCNTVDVIFVLYITSDTDNIQSFY